VARPKGFAATSIDAICRVTKGAFILARRREALRSPATASTLRRYFELAIRPTRNQKGGSHA